MITPTAIETHYAGCRFRSRLEARWAMFFDALSIPWVYEPQGYQIGRDAYLPDFYLTELERWVEVKGELDGPGLAKLGIAAGTDGLPVWHGDGEQRPCDLNADWLNLARPAVDRILLLGDIPLPTVPWLHPLLRLVNGRHIVAQPVFWWGDMTVELGQDTVLGADVPSWLPHGRETAALDPHPRVVKAYEAARSARFEHGESGAA